MPNLSIRRLDEETARRLKVRAAREGTSLEETVRCILRAAVVDEEPLGTLIRRIAGRGIDLELPEQPIHWSSRIEKRARCSVPARRGTS